MRRTAWAALFWLAACSSDHHGGVTTPGPDASVEAGHGVPDASLDASLDASRDASREGPDASPEAAAEAAPLVEASVDAGLGYPTLLSETGLFTDMATETLGAGIRFYQPKYTLWSDGATKRRWLYLPPGAQVDTSDMDFWTYPVGTRVWKEFTVGGKRVETRLLRKAGPDLDDWIMIAYQWKDDQSDAVAVPDGVVDASGTPHDIPDQRTCHICHDNTKGHLLGVGAIQLSHQLEGLKLTDLMSEGRLSNPPAGPFTLPGNAVESAAIGYLHANCGDCHNRSSPLYPGISMQLFELTGQLATVRDTTAYQTAVDQPYPGNIPDRIVPGDPDSSEIYVRMDLRGSGQMPPVCTKLVDPTGVALIGKWIGSLSPGSDGGSDAGDAGAKQ
jgi:hypothetical protein